MTQTHNVAPSISSTAADNMAGYGSAASTEATPPSMALANANAAAAAAATLQERPKYVYGQNPANDASTTGSRDQDDSGSVAHGGAYSSEPQMQTSYNAEAYGSYAQYADAGADVVGGTGVAVGGYQDAQREYLGQQGYDQNQQAYYDQNAYAAGYNNQAQQGYYDQSGYVATGYDQQAQYNYSQQGYDQAQYNQAQ